MPVDFLVEHFTDKFIVVHFVGNSRSLFGTSEGEWLHDKFAEIEAETGDGNEAEGDNQPSSTTEK